MAARLRIPVYSDSVSEREDIRPVLCLKRWVNQLAVDTLLLSLASAKILAQIQNVPGVPPMDIYAQAKAKEPANDAIPNFLALYKTAHRVGTLLKESHTGKLVSEWQKVVAESDSNPELVEMAPAVSSLMAVKDSEELVSPEGIARITHIDSR